jgi:surface antigen
MSSQRRRLRAEEISDEMLMAYIDGDPMLTSEERRQIDELLPRHPELVERMISFLYTKDQVRRAFDETMEVPERLIRQFAPTPAFAHAEPARPMAKLREWFRPAGGGWGNGLAFAAVATFLVAGPLGWYMNNALLGGRTVEIDMRGLKASGPMRTALELTESKTKTTIATGVQVTPTATFASAEQWCRLFLLTYADQRETPGVACREEDGSWRIRAQGSTRPTPPENTTLGPPPDAFSDFISGLRTGNSLGQPEEAKVLEQRWGQKPSQ